MNKLKIKKILKALKSILYEDQIISDIDILDQYSRDETSDLSYQPDIVVRANSVKEILPSFSS